MRNVDDLGTRGRYYTIIFLMLLHNVTLPIMTHLLERQNSGKDGRGAIQMVQALSEAVENRLK